MGWSSSKSVRDQIDGLVTSGVIKVRKRLLTFESVRTHKTFKDYARTSVIVGSKQLEFLKGIFQGQYSGQDIGAASTVRASWMLLHPVAGRERPLQRIIL